MTAPTAQRCAREGCGLPLNDSIHNPEWYGITFPSLGIPHHAFVSPQEEQAPRAMLEDVRGSFATMPAFAAALGDTATPQAPRCDSVTGGGRYRCEHDAGHTGRHKAAGTFTTWDDSAAPLDSGPREPTPERVRRVHVHFCPKCGKEFDGCNFTICLSCAAEEDAATTPPGGPASEPTLNCAACGWELTHAPIDGWLWCDAKLCPRYQLVVREPESCPNCATQAASLAALRCAATEYFAAMEEQEKVQAVISAHNEIDHRMSRSDLAEWLAESSRLGVAGRAAHQRMIAANAALRALTETQP